LEIQFATESDFHLESQFLSSASTVFQKGIKKNDDEKEKETLFKKVGQLQMAVDFLKKVLARDPIQVNRTKGKGIQYFPIYCVI